jgi:hypothetical protein
MSTSEEVAKEALEAARRGSEALLSKIANQLNQQNEVLQSQSEAPGASNAIDQPSANRSVFQVCSVSLIQDQASDAIKKQAEPLEKVQNICSSSSAALAGHISGKEPLSIEQLESMKSNLDEGKRLCKIRLRYHEDYDLKGINVADEILLIRSEGERDPSELAVEEEALKRVEKRKAEALAAKSEVAKVTDQKTKRKQFSWNQCYDCAWLSLTALSTVTRNLWL